MPIFNICDYGASGDGLCNDAKAIQRTIDACEQSGGGRILIPSGKVFCSGSIFLKANMELHVEAGACLLASDRPEHYVTPPGIGRPGEQEQLPQAFIAAWGQKHVTVSGHGVIDGNATAFVGKSTRYHTSGRFYPRPALVLLADCSEVTVKDITLRNSHFWTLHTVGCRDVYISGVRILNRLDMANCDGIDLDHCKDVRVVNCHIEAADDCIVLKNTLPFLHHGPTENVLISGCTLVSTSAAIKIGTESADDFRRVQVDSCIISRSNRGLSIQLRDQGNVEDIHFSNIQIETRRFSDDWWGSAEPIHISALNRNRDTEAGRVRRVQFSRINCRGENGAYIRGQPNCPIENIVFDQVQIELIRMTKWPTGSYDLRPNAGDPFDRRTGAGIYAGFVDGLEFRRVEVVQDGRSDAVEAFVMNNVRALRFDQVNAR